MRYHRLRDGNDKHINKNMANFHAICGCLDSTRAAVTGCIIAVAVTGDDGAGDFAGMPRMALARRRGNVVMARQCRPSPWRGGGGVKRSGRHVIERRRNHIVLLLTTSKTVSSDTVNRRHGAVNAIIKIMLNGGQ